MHEVLDFEEFAASRARKLFQIAYLMCGDWHQAQDLVQATLGKLFAVWGRVRPGRGVVDLDAYARKVLLRTYLSHRRLRRSGELAVADLPDRPAGEPGGGPELRLTLLAALRRLPPRNRAVVVLRYLEDWGVSFGSRRAVAAGARTSTASRQSPMAPSLRPGGAPTAWTPSSAPPMHAPQRRPLIRRDPKDTPCSIEAVAEALGTSTGAVKSLNTRSLARLRELLGQDREALFPH
ncbi:sigma-70 family RNA polymerase sigma factor [Kitasatospora sp. LaBMicrA B282]|uniref:sigma-70 family RNA polymerase sigma factor n=1 Tax=Kitasatospora sp. LaBMicrA B282 TaxID=3420949 RepID=UPI003D14A3DD